jgi:hypothetical protein
MCFQRLGLVGAVGIEPSSSLKTRKLFIPRSDKNYKTATNAEVRYTAGTRTLAVSVSSCWWLVYSSAGSSASARWRYFNELPEISWWPHYIHLNHLYTVLRGFFRIVWRVGIHTARITVVKPEMTVMIAS